MKLNGWHALHLRLANWNTKETRISYPDTRTIRVIPCAKPFRTLNARLWWTESFNKNAGGGWPESVTTPELEEAIFYARYEDLSNNVR